MAARVLGRNVFLMVNSAKWLFPIALGELDEFRATSTTEMVKSRPIGYALEAATLRYGGYQLQMKVGKTDPMLARWNHLIDRGLIGGSQPPELFVFEIIRHYYPLNDSLIAAQTLLGPSAGTNPGGGGSQIQGALGHVVENWVYKNVTLHSPDIAFSGQDEYEQSIQGFAAYKELGPIDVSFIKLNWLAEIGFQEVVYRTKDIDGGLAQDITSSINNVLGKR